MGEKNSEVLKQVLEENLENAITFKKSESGYHQNPIDRDLGLTKSQNGENEFPTYLSTFATQLSIEHAQRPNGAKASLANSPFFLIRCQRICQCSKHNWKCNVFVQILDFSISVLNTNFKAAL